MKIGKIHVSFNKDQNKEWVGITISQLKNDGDEHYVTLTCAQARSLAKAIDIKTRGGK
jgi:hypothetical protein